MPVSNHPVDTAEMLRDLLRRVTNLERAIMPRTNLSSGQSDGSIPLLKSSIQTGAAYTFVFTDALTVVEGNSASAQIFTVPPNIFPPGTVWEVYQRGAGQIAIAPGTGITLKSDGDKFKTAGQKASIGLRMSTGTECVLTGDLA